MIDTFFYNLFRQIATPIMRYNLTVIDDEYANVPPVSYAELAGFLRLDQVYDEAVVNLLGQAATITFENAAKINVMQKTFQVDFDGFFPNGLTIPARPLQEVLSVTYKDQNLNVTQLTEGADYLVAQKATYSKIVAPQTKTFPIPYNGPNVVSIQFVAGLANDPAKVPGTVKTAILLWANHFYRNREPIIAGQTIAKMPYGLETLVSLYNAPEV